MVNHLAHEKVRQFRFRCSLCGSPKTRGATDAPPEELMAEWGSTAPCGRPWVSSPENHGVWRPGFGTLSTFGVPKRISDHLSWQKKWDVEVGRRTSSSGAQDMVNHSSTPNLAAWDGDWPLDGDDGDFRLIATGVG